jgi:hypothetical protein
VLQSFLPACRGGEELIRLGDSQFTILVLVEKTMGFSFIGDELAALAGYFIEFDEIFWLQRETDHRRLVGFHILAQFSFPLFISGIRGIAFIGPSQSGIRAHPAHR